MSNKDNRHIWESYNIPQPDEDPNYRHPPLGKKGPRCGKCKYFNDSDQAAEQHDFSRTDGAGFCEKLERNCHAWGVCDLFEDTNQIGISEGIGSMDKLIMKAAEHFEKMKGKFDHEIILHKLEQHYLKFLRATPEFPDSNELIGYIEDEGFRDDLINHLALDNEDDINDIWDQSLSRYDEKHK